MVIQRFGSRVEKRWVEQLVRLQAPGGGYPTFRPTGIDAQPLHAWQRPHADVTVLMIEMMERLGPFKERQERAWSCGSGRARAGGTASVLVEGEAYALWVPARVGALTAAASRLAVARLVFAQGVPDVPMYLTAALADGKHCAVVEAGVTRLLQAQLVDGSWSCDPCLRVTDPTHMRAGPEAPGLVFGDRRRVFSTAHAVETTRRGARLRRRSVGLKLE